MLLVIDSDLKRIHLFGVVEPNTHSIYICTYPICMNNERFYWVSRMSKCYKIYTRRHLYVWMFKVGN